MIDFRKQISLNLSDSSFKMALTANVSNGGKNLAKVWLPRIIVSRKMAKIPQEHPGWDTPIEGRANPRELGLRFRTDWTKYIFPLHLPFREDPDPLD